MAIKKHEHYNEIPNHFTTDIDGSCVIFELNSHIDSMTSFECLYKAVKVITYDGVDAVVQEPKGSNAKSMLVEIRNGGLLPEFYNEFELTWFESDTSLDDILTMSVI